MNRQRDWNNLSLSLSRTPHIGNNPLLTDSFWMKLFFHQLVTSKFTSKCINRRDKLFRITHSLAAFNRKNTILFNLVRSFFRAFLLPERSWIFQSNSRDDDDYLSPVWIVWPEKNRQISINVAQKWFHKKNEWLWHIYKNCLRMWEIWTD